MKGQGGRGRHREENRDEKERGRDEGGKAGGHDRTEKQ